MTNENATNLLDKMMTLAGFYNKSGLARDFQLSLSLYGMIFREIMADVEEARSLAPSMRAEPEMDYRKPVKSIFSELLDLKSYAKEIGEEQTYFRLIATFAKPYRDLLMIADEEIKEYRKEQRANKIPSGGAKITRYPKSRADIERSNDCEDCPPSTSGATIVEPRIVTGTSKPVSLADKMEIARKKGAI